MQQALMGHSSMQMTEHYSSVNGDEKREAVAKVISLMAYKEVERGIGMMHGLQLVGSVHGTGPAPGCLRKGTISYIRGAHGGAQGGWRTIPYLAVNEKRPMFQGLLGAGNRIRTGDVQLGKLTLYQLSYSRRKSTHMIKAGLGDVSREKERGLDVGVGEVVATDGLLHAVRTIA